MAELLRLLLEHPQATAGGVGLGAGAVGTAWLVAYLRQRVQRGRGAAAEARRTADNIRGGGGGRQ